MHGEGSTKVTGELAALFLEAAPKPFVETHYGHYGQLLAAVLHRAREARHGENALAANCCKRSTGALASSGVQAFDCVLHKLWVLNLRFSPLGSTRRRLRCGKRPAADRKRPTANRGLRRRCACTLANAAASQLQTTGPSQRFSFECVALLFSLGGLQKASCQERVDASRRRCQLCRAARRSRSVAHAF